MVQDVYHSTDASERGQLALDFDVDRDKAFRQARRHTVLVRTMRVMFPLTAVALFASYGIFVQRSVKLSHTPGQLKIDSASISTEALIAHNPRYEGFDDQGGKFIVHAKTAEQDFGQKGPIRLKTIDGQMIDASKVATDLKAKSGTYDTRSSVLELYERIDVVSQNGMTAELTRATVMTKDSRITSDEPVLVKMPTGTIKGRTMVIEQKKKQITFANGVVAHLKQEKPAKPAAPPPPAAKGAAAQQQPASLAASDAPVDITSQKLFVDDLVKTAVFTGNVVAKQEDSTLETPHLEVFYEGQAAGAAGVAPPKQATSDPAASSKVKRMVAKTDVVITRGTERATGRLGEFDTTTDRGVLTGSVVITSGPDRQATSDRAEFDNRSDTALLTGNVVVTQVKNQLKGRRLFIDRKASTMQMTSPAEPGAGKGRVTARMYQADTAVAGQKKDQPAQSAEAAKSPVGFGAMKRDPNTPIDIESDSLDVNDVKKTAIFRGNVHAVQGDYAIHTEELVATYAGDSGMALGPQQNAQSVEAKAADPKAQKPGEKQGAQLQRVQATKRAIVTTKDGRTASGNTADFDTKANIVTLVGDVTLSQHNSITTGSRAVLNMTTGVMQLEESIGAVPAAAGSSVAGAPGQGRQRIQALLYPQQIKDRDGSEKPGQPAPAAAAGAAPAPGTKAAPPAAALPARPASAIQQPAATARPAGPAVSASPAAVAPAQQPSVAAEPPAPPAPKRKSEDWLSETNPFGR